MRARRVGLRQRSTAGRAWCGASEAPRESGASCGLRKREKQVFELAAVGRELAGFACRTRRPLAMIAASSTLCATSARRWLDIRTVPPSSARPEASVAAIAHPSGSRPFAGSSRVSTLGQPSGAVASPRRAGACRARTPSLAAGRPRSGRPARAPRPPVPPGLRQRRRRRRGGRGRAGSDGSRWSRAPPPRAARVLEPAIGERAADGDRARSRRREPEQHPLSVVVFPAPFGPREGGHRSRRDIEAQRVHRRHRAVALRRITYRDRTHRTGSGERPPIVARRSGAPGIPLTPMPVACVSIRRPPAEGLTAGRP